MFFGLTNSPATFQTMMNDIFDKQNVMTAPVLISPNSTQPFHIEADSSDFATRAVLSQVSPGDGKWHPVAFFSKSLSLVEHNYEMHDKEMLAIIQSLQEWQHFLLKVPSTNSKFGQTTKTWNISCQPNNSTAGKPSGHSTSPALISSSITDLASLWANPMHFPSVIGWASLGSHVTLPM
jgi:hypothetical protein